MIHGIGVDMIEIGRIEETLAKFGQRFITRTLTAQEKTEFEQHKAPARFFAKRFAAKEAAAKALGTGFRGGVAFKHIEVAHDTKGKPDLHYHGYTAQLIQTLGIQNSHLSISDTEEHALAFVVLEKKDRR
ncbi:MAG: holo-ACP synthase [Pseudomonadota bacterium]